MIAIISSTFKEVIRKKTFIVMGIITILFIIFWAVILNYFQDAHLSEKNVTFNSLASIVLTQTVLQFSSMLMCLITIVLGAGAIASELENGMIHAILSRPLDRMEYIFGKLFGLSILIAAYATALFTTILLIGRIYSLDTITMLTFDQVFEGWIFYTLVPLILLSLTICGSIRLKMISNGLLMIFIYILGNIGGMVEMIGNYLNNKAMDSSGIFLSLISPFHTLYTTAEGILLPSSGLTGEVMRVTGGLTGRGQPASSVMFIYIIIYTLGFIALAISKFRKIDINS